MNITRRAALGGIACISATGAALAVGQSATPENAQRELARPPGPELPVEKIVRLARELSKALDELNADAYTQDWGSDEVGIFIANVWPRINPNVVLEQRGIPIARARFARAVS